MEAVTTRLQEAVNQLIEICDQGEQGFEAAAEAVTDERLSAELMQYSRQRGEFATELRDVLDVLGGSFENRASLSGVLHLGWLNLQNTLSGHDDQAILEECARGEADAIETYREVLGYPLPSLVGEVIASQYQSIKRIYNRIRMIHCKVHQN
jgi:uncharacterized protein (TIGR02284 family)